MNDRDATTRAAVVNRLIDREPLRRQDGVLIFVEPPATSPAAARSAFDALRERLKGLGNAYQLLKDVFAPVLRAQICRRTLAATLARHAPGAAVLNLGSGPGRGLGRGLERADVVNVDLHAMPGVDMVADLADLPVKDASVDLALSIAVLEHVPDPGRLVAEMIRTLRPGGEIFCFMPFLQPFHAAPDDFSRLTLPGLLHLFGGLEIVATGVGAGPVSGLLWTAQHVAAMALSLGSARAYSLFLILLTAVTWPVKYLDLLFERHPAAVVAASGFFVVARKAPTP